MSPKKLLIQEERALQKLQIRDLKKRQQNDIQSYIKSLTNDLKEGDMTQSHSASKKVIAIKEILTFLSKESMPPAFQDAITEVQAQIDKIFICQDADKYAKAAEIIGTQQISRTQTYEQVTPAIRTECGAHFEAP